MKFKTKRKIKILIMVVALSFVFTNWRDFSWIFSHRTTTVLLQDLLRLNIADNSLKSIVTDDMKTDDTETKEILSYFEKENSLEISTIGITAPLVISSSTNEKELLKSLDMGAVYYPGSVLPGEKGQTIILGHSAPQNWPHIKHDWIFSDIEDLKPGDTISLYFNNKQYNYSVRGKKIINPGDDLKPVTSDMNKNILILISCWPPGKNYKRIAIDAELEPAVKILTK